MPLLIVRNDITKMQVDAIVNAAKPSLLGGGGVDGAIHAAAGPELLEACRDLGGCPVGQVRLTPGFRLPCKWVIHTVGPVWQGGAEGEREQLLSCYRRALELAESLGCESIAFPLIASGAHGYPKDKAVETAREAIRDFLWSHEMLVYLVVFGEESLAASRASFGQIREYIDSTYAQRKLYRRSRWETEQARREAEDFEMAPREAEDYSLLAPQESGGFVETPEAAPAGLPRLSRKNRRKAPSAPAPAPDVLYEVSNDEFAAPSSLFDSRFGMLDESFQQMLLRLIDERGITDADCYRRANVDRKHFSKIRKDVHYHPSKTTALAFAVALELTIEETEELLEKAGYALSRSNRFDLIVRWFIERGIYDVFTINEALFEFDQTLLGCAS